MHLVCPRQKTYCTVGWQHQQYKYHISSTSLVIASINNASISSTSIINTSISSTVLASTTPASAELYYHQQHQHQAVLYYHQQYQHQQYCTTINNTNNWIGIVVNMENYVILK